VFMLKCDASTVSIRKWGTPGWPTGSRLAGVEIPKFEKSLYDFSVAFNSSILNLVNLILM
jgi:hypothetical protein